VYTWVCVYVGGVGVCVGVFAEGCCVLCGGVCGGWLSVYVGVCVCGHVYGEVLCGCGGVCGCVWVCVWRGVAWVWSKRRLCRFEIVRCV